ncbi:MAG: methionyl-tRNA formyltransferase [Blastocatellia bacterium]
MNLIFMGTPEFAVPSLQKLIDAGHTITAVFTQPDKPVGRKQIITPPPVKVLATQHNIPVHQPHKIRTEDARRELEPLFKSVDAGVVAAYGRILPEWMLLAPKHGCVNVHSSLLPKYRGAAPINWAIVNGETETGVTIMQMEEGLDTGPILLQRKLAIGDDERTPELTARLAELGANLLIETLAKLEAGELQPIQQINKDATYAHILKREDGLIDWTMTATQIRNRLRGFTPFPGCYTMLHEQKLEITNCQAEPGAEGAAAGTVVEVAKDSFVVACGGQTQLRVTELQAAGKRVMPARDWLNGAKLQAGEQLQ